MARTIGGVLAGIVAGLATMFVIAFIGGLLFPISGEADMRGPEQLVSVFGAAPAGAKAAILLAWFASGLVGAAIAARIGRSAAAGWAVAALLTLLVLANIFFLPMPGWMQVVAVAAPLVGGLLGVHLGGRRAGGVPGGA